MRQLRYIAYDDKGMVLDIIEFVDEKRKDGRTPMLLQKLIYGIIDKDYVANGRVGIEFLRDERTGLPI